MSLASLENLTHLIRKDKRLLKTKSQDAFNFYAGRRNSAEEQTQPVLGSNLTSNYKKNNRMLEPRPLNKLGNNFKKLESSVAYHYHSQDILSDYTYNDATELYKRYISKQNRNKTTATIKDDYDFYNKQLNEIKEHTGCG